MSRPRQYEVITDRQVIGMMMHELETGSVGWVDQLAMRTESDQDGEEYGWLGTVPGLSEFLGGRSINEVKEYSFRIDNVDYEGNVRFQRKDLRRDKLGMIERRIAQFGERAMDHPAKLLSTLILNGEATPCYDGQFFYDTDHQDRQEGTQSNDIGAEAATPASPTAAEMTDGIMAAIQQMYGFKDDFGEPTNQMATDFMVMVPTTYMRPALEAVTSLLGDGGATALLPALRNAGRFNIGVQVNPRLSSWTTKFSVFRTDGPVRPFVLQEEYGPEPFALGPESEHCIKTGECMYGVDWGGNVGYGDWRRACLVTFG